IDFLEFSAALAAQEPEQPELEPEHAEPQGVLPSDVLELPVFDLTFPPLMAPEMLSAEPLATTELASDEPASTPEDVSEEVTVSLQEQDRTLDTQAAEAVTVQEPAAPVDE